MAAENVQTANVQTAVPTETARTDEHPWPTQPIPYKANGQPMSPVGMGETTAALHEQSTFMGWDFQTIWNAPSGSYPARRRTA